MKKKTPTQNYIDQAIQQAKKELSGTHISDCHIEMNLKATAAIESLCESLVQNAIAAQKIAELIKPSSVTAIRFDQAGKICDFHDSPGFHRDD